MKRVRVQKPKQGVSISDRELFALKYRQWLRRRGFHGEARFHESLVMREERKRIQQEEA